MINPARRPPDLAVAIQPADELAERKCAYQRDVAKANRIADEVFWLVLAERRHERLQ